MKGIRARSSENRSLFSPPQIVVLAVLLAAAFVYFFAGLTGTFVFGWDVLGTVVLYGVTLLVLTLYRNIFLDLVAVLSCVFYFHPMVVLTAGLRPFQWQRTIVLDDDLFLKTSIFLTLVNGAVLLGYFAFRWTAHVFGARGHRSWSRLLWEGADFETSFRVFFVVACPLVLLSIYLRAALGANVPGIGTRNAVPGFWIRLANLTHPLLFIPWLVLLSDWVSRNTKILAAILVLLYIMSFAARLSRAAFVTPILIGLVFPAIFLGKKMRWNHVLWGTALICFIALSWLPITAARRGVPIAEVFSLSRWFSFSGLGGPGWLIEYISMRLGGFDRLAGILAVDWSGYSRHIGPIKDLSQLLNGFVPGQVIDTSKVSLPHFLPTVLLPRTTVTDYGINPTLPGRVYAYFGYFAAFVVVGAWTFISTWVMHLSRSVIIAILYLLPFGVSFFVGSFPNPIFIFIQGLVVLALVRLISVMTKTSVLGRAST